uniref:Uncharacterized protein n=1 Tax=Arundo donax TaxID=35708 RepID=A0A0A9U719_ARUDO
MDLGPSVIRIMSATALAAWMLAWWTFAPDSRFSESFSTRTGACNAIAM